MSSHVIGSGFRGSFSAFWQGILRTVAGLLIAEFRNWEEETSGDSVGLRGRVQTDSPGGLNFLCLFRRPNAVSR